jgi:hypothetical protein
LGAGEFGGGHELEVRSQRRLHGRHLGGHLEAFGGEGGGEGRGALG